MDEIFAELAYELLEEKWRIVEEEKKWRQEAKRERNAKKQKDKPRFPLRVQTLNTTVANHIHARTACPTVQDEQW